MSEHRTIGPKTKARLATRKQYRRLKAMKTQGILFFPNAGEPAFHFVNEAAKREVGAYGREPYVRRLPPYKRALLDDTRRLPTREERRAAEFVGAIVGKHLTKVPVHVAGYARSAA